MSRPKQNVFEPESPLDTPVANRSPILDESDIRHRIAEAAYFRAEKRNFEPGYEVEDWIAAESDIGAAANLGNTGVNRAF